MTDPPHGNSRPSSLVSILLDFIHKLLSAFIVRFERALNSKSTFLSRTLDYVITAMLILAMALTLAGAVYYIYQRFLREIPEHHEVIKRSRKPRDKIRTSNPIRGRSEPQLHTNRGDHRDFLFLSEVY